MKLKKVEISAFRIFDNVDDAKFDFSIGPDDGVADFASIYAPNGFGKTSFYDAIEWGMTGSINRFLLKSDENKKLLANSLSNEKFLGNINSSYETFVRIHPFSKPAIERILKKHGKQKHDFRFDRFSKIERPEFQQVILSQEWISAFLMESDGVVRFEKFMKLPELNDINQYYKNVKGLIQANVAQIKELKNECSGLKKEIQTFEDENLLQTVNSRIHLLNIKGESLEPISPSGDRKAILQFQNSISQRMIEIETVIDSYNAERLDLETVRSGNSEMVGLNLYFENISHRDAIDAELERVGSLIALFETLIKNRNKLRENEKRQTEQHAEITRYEELERDFKEWKRVDSELKSRLKFQELERSTLEVMETELNDFRDKKIELESQLESCLSQENDIRAKLDRLPNLKATFGEATDLKTKALTSLSQLRLSQGKLIADQKRLEDELLDRITRIQDFNGRNHLELNEEFIILEKPLNQIRASSSELVTTQFQLEALEEAIDDQSSFNVEIEEFVRQGLAIAIRRETSECPLCMEKYDSYAELAQRISNNTALNALLQERLKEKNALESRLSNLRALIESSRAVILTLLESSKSKLESEVNEARTQTERAERKITDLERSVFRADETLIQIEAEVNAQGFIHYEEGLRTELKELEQRKVAISKDLQDVLSKQTSGAEMASIHFEKLEAIKTDIASLSLHTEYVKIEQYFHTNHPGRTPEVGVLKEVLDISIERSEMLASTKVKIESEISDLESKLTGHTIDDLKARHFEYSEMRSTKVSAIESFREYLKSRLDIVIENLDQAQTEKELNKIERNLKKAIKGQQGIVEEYTKLLEFSRNLEPFLLSEHSRIRLAEKKKELKVWEKDMRSLLVNERDRVKDHLQKRVKDFFYEDLINDLYKRIDPHPDFKKVEFKPDFEADPPRLDVSVRDSNNNRELIPNLYYSTAQINILSLSIFLASALKSSEYDCIFIDDPIQSMDSINVLSTIDLLRSIIVNHGKQIILSTHDQNFHNLLRKKMPPGLFRSKFIELESFGKVKQDNDAS